MPYFEAKEKNTLKKISQPVVLDFHVLARGFLGVNLYGQPSLEVFFVNFDKYLPAKTGKFTCVDFSDNYISSKEMEFVLSLGEHLVDKEFIGEDCMLLLSNNQIHGIEKKQETEFQLYLVNLQRFSL